MDAMDSEELLCKGLEWDVLINEVEEVRFC